MSSIEHLFSSLDVGAGSPAPSSSPPNTPSSSRRSASFWSPFSAPPSTSSLSASTSSLRTFPNAGSPVSVPASSSSITASSSPVSSIAPGSSSSGTPATTLSPISAPPSSSSQFHTTSQLPQHWRMLIPHWDPMEWTPTELYLLNLWAMEMWPDYPGFGRLVDYEWEKEMEWEVEKAFGESPKVVEVKGEEKALEPVAVEEKEPEVEKVAAVVETAEIIDEDGKKEEIEVATVAEGTESGEYKGKGRAIEESKDNEVDPGLKELGEFDFDAFLAESRANDMNPDVEEGEESEEDEEDEEERQAELAELRAVCYNKY